MSTLRPVSPEFDEEYVICSSNSSSSEDEDEKTLVSDVEPPIVKEIVNTRGVNLEKVSTLTEFSTEPQVSRENCSSVRDMLKEAANYKEMENEILAESQEAQRQFKTMNSREEFLKMIAEKDAAGKKNAENEAVEATEKETSEKQNPEKETSEKQNPEKLATEKQNPEKQNPENLAAEKQNPEKQNPEKLATEKETSEKQNPEKQNPEKLATENLAAEGAETNAEIDFSAEIKKIDSQIKIEKMICGSFLLETEETEHEDIRLIKENEIRMLDAKKSVEKLAEEKKIAEKMLERLCAENLMEEKLAAEKLIEKLDIEKQKGEMLIQKLTEKRLDLERKHNEIASYKEQMEADTNKKIEKLIAQKEAIEKRANSRMSVENIAAKRDAERLDAEKLRLEQEAEKLRLEQETEKLRREEAEKIRREEAEKIRLEVAEKLRLEVAEKIRLEQEAEKSRLEAAEKRRLEVAEKLRLVQEAKRLAEEQEAKKLAAKIIKAEKENRQKRISKRRAEIVKNEHMATEKLGTETAALEKRVSEMQDAASSKSVEMNEKMHYSSSEPSSEPSSELEKTIEHSSKTFENSCIKVCPEKSNATSQTNPFDTKQDFSKINDLYEAKSNLRCMAQELLKLENANKELKKEADSAKENLRLETERFTRVKTLYVSDAGNRQRIICNLSKQMKQLGVKPTYDVGENAEAVMHFNTNFEWLKARKVEAESKLAKLTTLHKKSCAEYSEKIAQIEKNLEEERKISEKTIEAQNKAYKEVSDKLFELQNGESRDNCKFCKLSQDYPVSRQKSSTASTLEQELAEAKTELGLQKQNFDLERDKTASEHAIFVDLLREVCRNTIKENDEKWKELTKIFGDGIEHLENLRDEACQALNEASDSIQGVDVKKFTSLVSDANLRMSKIELAIKALSANFPMEWRDRERVFRTEISKQIVARKNAEDELSISNRQVRFLKTQLGLCEEKLALSSSRGLIACFKSLKVVNTDCPMCNHKAFDIKRLLAENEISYCENKICKLKEKREELSASKEKAFEDVKAGSASEDDVFVLLLTIGEEITKIDMDIEKTEYDLGTLKSFLPTCNLQSANGREIERVKDLLDVFLSQVDRAIEKSEFVPENIRAIVDPMKIVFDQFKIIAEKIKEFAEKPAEEPVLTKAADSKENSSKIEEARLFFTRSLYVVANHLTTKAEEKIREFSKKLLVGDRKEEFGEIFDVIRIKLLKKFENFLENLLNKKFDLSDPKQTETFFLSTIEILGEALLFQEKAIKLIKSGIWFAISNNDFENVSLHIVASLRDNFDK